jgi:uncharacterized protein YutE (UPF0331/DUF86 family)
MTVRRSGVRRGRIYIVGRRRCDVARDVMVRKLQFLRLLLDDLRPYRGAAIEQVQAEHYKLERLLELLATAASDLVFHLLRERGVEVHS